MKTEIYERLAKYFHQVQDFKNESDAHAKYISLRDTMFNEDVMQRMAIAHTEFLQQSNHDKIKTQKKILTLKEVVIQRQQNIVPLAIIGIFLMIIVIVILFTSYRSKRRIASLLDSKVEERTAEILLRNNRLGQTQVKRIELRKLEIRSLQKLVEDLNNSIAKRKPDPKNITSHDYLLRIMGTATQISRILETTKSKDL